MIIVATRDTVIAAARENLHLPAGTELDRPYWIATLRRLAGQLCPCSPRTLINSVLDSHQSLVVADDALVQLIEDLLDGLVAAGDLLELSDVTTLDETVKGTWLFTAPPSFVMHSSGAAFLTGIAGDEALPLPAELLQRVQTRGFARVLSPLVNEDLSGLLNGLGLRALSMSSWLRYPKMEGAAALLGALGAKLAVQRAAGVDEDLRILDWTRSARRYRDRWVAPTHQTGSFVLRRPQAYGADLWGYGRFEDGRLEGLIDFPPPGSRWRGCDIAWRVQLAIDALGGRPQRYRVRGERDFTQFDFFFPLPDWARRRLAIVGEEVPPDGCLMSFRIPSDEAAAEATFLHDYLFFDSDEQTESELT
jgi:hypothetical protein